ncbi:MAG: hypothetical protein ACLGH0_02205, partial [Thermoanaerobaculia bacterium]
MLVVTSGFTRTTLARQPKKNFSKTTVGRIRMVAPQPGTDAGEPAVSLLAGLEGGIVELYDDFALVEINNAHRSELERRGRQQSVLVTVRDEFDNVFINGKIADVREADSGLPEEPRDAPYLDDQQGTWIIQFIGPVKNQWLESVAALKIVPVQYVPSHAYIVAGRKSAIDIAAELPFVQWTSQMHRYFKPSVGTAAGTALTSADQENTAIELWIELAQTDDTPAAIARLGNLSIGGIETAPWSETEVRVQGLFRSDDVDTILGEPLVFGLAERPMVELSDERAALGVSSVVPSVGSPSRDAGKYKKWLRDLCSSCTNLQADGFYIGMADTGLDGGDRIASGTIAGEKSSSDLHRDDLAKTRILWGRSFAPATFATGQTWTNCGTGCPDTTGSKHDTYG